MGEGGFRSVIESLIHFSIVWCNGKKFPLVTSKTCPQFIFFPKLNTTVKIHRAQRIHICSTRYTLYKLDMYNSTECLNPRGSPTTKKCLDERDGESERAAGGAVSVLLGDVLQRTSQLVQAQWRRKNQSKGRLRLSRRLLFGFFPLPVGMYFTRVYTKSFSSDKGNGVRPFPFGPDRSAYSNETMFSFTFCTSYISKP